MQFPTERVTISLATSAVVGAAGLSYYPFPAEHAVLQLILARQPFIFHVFSWTYTTLLFTTPFLFCSVILSIAYIFASRTARRPPKPALPP